MMKKTNTFFSRKGGIVPILIVLLFGAVFYFIFRNHIFYVLNVLAYDNPVFLDGVKIKFKKGLSYEKYESSIIIKDSIHKDYTIYVNTNLTAFGPKNVSYTFSTKDRDIFLDFTKKLYKIESNAELVESGNTKYYIVTSSDSMNQLTAIVWFPNERLLGKYFGTVDEHNTFLSLVNQLEFNDNEETITK